jgi:glyoxylase-like metal-dependent hydrolase (beta-lactamase superfamily II)
MSIEYEFDARPRDGETLTIAEGIEWLRMPLPFSLNHINLWLLRDDERWAIVDTGVGTADLTSESRDESIWYQTS